MKVTSNKSAILYGRMYCNRKCLLEPTKLSCPSWVNQLKSISILAIGFRVELQCHLIMILTWPVKSICSQIACLPGFDVTQVVTQF